MVSRRARHDLAVDAHDALGPQSFEGLEAGRAGMGDQLGQAIVVAQVDEQQAAVVALAVDPARQTRTFAPWSASRRAPQVWVR